MDSLRFEHGAAGYPVSVEWLPLTEGKSAERPGMRTGHNYVAVAEKDPRVQRFAQTGGIRDDRVENRLKIARRLADDAQHLRCRRLLLERLGELARARLHLVEQPHVLDRDHRLVGERLQQLHLFVRKWPHRAARQREYPDRCLFTQQGRADHGAIAAEFLCQAQLVFRIGLRIKNLNSRTLKQSSTGHAAAPRLEWYALQLILQLGGPAEVGLRLKEPLIVRTRNVSDVGLAKSNRRFDQRIEHHLKIECRAADDLEHVGGRSLLL